MVSHVYNKYLPELVDSGEVAIERIDDAVRRVLRAKFKAGLFERPYVDEDLHESVLGRDDHRQAALDLAEQCIVMTKNDGILPLAKTGKWAVLGPFAAERRAHLGSWCLDAYEHEIVTIIDGLRAAALDTEIVFGESHSQDYEMGICLGSAWGGGGIDAAIVCVGEHQYRNGEASNIAHLELPPGQEQLIEAIGQLGIPVVVVNCSGRPLAGCSGTLRQGYFVRLELRHYGRCCYCARHCW